MQELDDSDLLRLYVEQASEEAFAILVTRHVNKVYSVALRHTRNPSQAEEITQAVFVILARKARRLRAGAILSGWLYQTARLTALTFIRGEIRRARRTQEAHMQTSLNETESEAWTQIAPELDAAMAGLNEMDRQAVVLRFFDGKTMKEVGTALGASEDAAKMRVSRSVEKLRLFFMKRGIVLSAGLLTATLSAHSVQAAPVSLVKTVTAVAITKGAAASSSTLTLIKGALKIMAWTKAKTTVVAAVILIMAAGTTTLIVKHYGPYSRVKLHWTAAGKGAFQRETALRINQSKMCALSCFIFADDHQNQWPTNFEQLKKLGSLDAAQWEFVSGGDKTSFTNPRQTILIREKQSRPSPDGKFVKIYVFADGSVQVLSYPNDDFAAMEQERGFLTQPARN